MSACSRCSAPVEESARFCARCGAMTEAGAPVGGDPLIGRVVLDRYRVLEVLGEGGMGTVYLAEQQMGQATRPVALKTLKRELTNDPRFAGRFRRESEIVIQLSHPNTIQFYDFGALDDGTLVIAMEYIEGRTLAEELRRGALPDGRIDGLLSQICGSLAEAHERGIVHRDLKPQNILLTTRGGQEDFVKVVDFGIALKSARDDGDTRITTQGTLIGTPPYMSPEQFEGSDVDARSDVYSLGVMLYEMTAGRLPFDARTPWDWATAHLTREPHPITDCVPGLDPARADAVMAALEKNPADRPQSVEALLEALGIGDPTRTPSLRPATGHRGDSAAARATSPHEADTVVAPGNRARPRKRAPVVTWLPVVLLLSGGLLLTLSQQREVDADSSAASEVEPPDKRTLARERAEQQKRAAARRKARAERRAREEARAAEEAKKAEEARTEGLALITAAIDADDLETAMIAYARLGDAGNDDRVAQVSQRLSALGAERIDELLELGDCGSVHRILQRMRAIAVQTPDNSSVVQRVCEKPAISGQEPEAPSAENELLQ